MAVQRDQYEYEGVAVLGMRLRRILLNGIEIGYAKRAQGGWDAVMVSGQAMWSVAFCTSLRGVADYWAKKRGWLR